MSATVAIPNRTAPTALSGSGIIRSEWIKLRSLRSTVWSYAIVVLVSVGLAVLMSATLTPEMLEIMADGEHAAMAAQTATFGVFFGQLVVAVLGVLVISGEYSTGMIRSTLTAVPRRLPTLWAKALVLFVATFVVGIISGVAAFLAAMPILSGLGVHASLFEPLVLQSLLGGALYLALVSVFALGIGTMLRSSAGGVAAALGIVLLLPIVFQMIPAQWAADVLPYLISQAGLEMFGMPQPGDTAIDMLDNLLIVLAWVAVSLAGAALLLKRRDA
jgi:ABC-2 type transport system permease protein